MALSSVDVDAAVNRACSLLLQHQQAHTKAWVRNTDWLTACNYLAATHRGETPSRIAVIDNAFVMYAVGANWWAKRPIVHEELLLSLDERPVDLARVTGFLEQVARQEGAAGVAFGTSLSQRDPALIRLYRSHGYANEASMLYKEIS